MTNEPKTPSPHPLTDRFWKMRRERIRRWLICGVVAALSLLVLTLAAIRGDAQLPYSNHLAGGGELTPSTALQSCVRINDETIAKIDALQATLNEIRRDVAEIRANR